MTESNSELSPTEIANSLQRLRENFDRADQQGMPTIGIQNEIAKLVDLQKNGPQPTPVQKVESPTPEPYPKDTSVPQVLSESEMPEEPAWMSDPTLKMVEPVRKETLQEKQQRMQHDEQVKQNGLTGVRAALDRAKANLTPTRPPEIRRK